MKNKKYISLALSLVLAMTSLTPVFAEKANDVKKDETVFVLMDENGKIKEQTVSVWLHSDKPIDLLDQSNLTDIVNLKSDENPIVKGDKVHWKSKKKDIYYKGASTKELPVDIEVSYKLDGKEIKPKKLVGKSGKLEITIRAKNKEKYVRNVNGKNETLYIPYVVAGGLQLPVDNYKNVDTNAKVMDDGKNQAVGFTLVPGMSEMFKKRLNDIDIDIDDYVENEITINADVKNFERPTLLFTVADLFQTDPEFEEFDSFDELTDALKELDDKGQELLDGVVDFSDAIYDLVDAHDDLYDGSNELYDGVNTLQESVEDAIDGTNKLSSGSKDLNDGARKLNLGLRDLVEGVNTLNDKMEDLTDGARKLKEGTDQLVVGVEQMRDSAHAAKDKYNEYLSTSKINEYNNKISESEKAFGDISNNANSTLDDLVQLRQHINNKKVDANSSKSDDKKKIESAVLALKKQSSDLDKAASALDSVINSLESAKRTGNTVNNDNVTGAAIQNLNVASSNIEDPNIKQSVDNAISLIGNVRSASTDGNEGEINDVKNNIQSQVSAIKNCSDMIKNQVNIIAKSANLDLEDIGTEVDSITKKHTQTVVGLSIVSKDMQNMTSRIKAVLNNEISPQDGMPSIGSKLDELVDGVDKLYDGSTELQDGQNELYDGTLKLQDGVSTLKEGSDKLYDGSTQLQEGTQKAVEGAQDLDEGINKLQLDGVSPLKDGMGKLNGGLATLANKKGDLTEGADDLLDGTQRYMDEGVKELRSEITEKTDDVEDIMNIRDELVKLSQENNSFSGKPQGVETKVKYIYKIN